MGSFSTSGGNDKILMAVLQSNIAVLLNKSEFKMNYAMTVGKGHMEGGMREEGAYILH